VVEPGCAEGAAATMDVCPRHRRAEVTCSSVSLAAG
jgi:hypothetical protein